MRTETITRTIYTFDELPENVKQKAVEKLYDLNVNCEWWQFIYEDANRVGIIINEFDLDRNRHCKIDISDCQETANLILKNYGEDCETFKIAKAFLDECREMVETAEKDEDGDYINDIDQEIDDVRNCFIKSISEYYAIILQKEYEYLTSEETIIKTIEANEYEFDENGNLA